MRIKRKIIQISTVNAGRPELEMGSADSWRLMVDVVALCDDGTVWYWDGMEWYDLEPVPQYDVPEE